MNFQLPLYYWHLFNTMTTFLSCYFCVQGNNAKLLVANLEWTTCCCFIYISSNKYLALIFFSYVNTQCIVNTDWIKAVFRWVSTHLSFYLLPPPASRIVFSQSLQIQFWRNRKEPRAMFPLGIKDASLFHFWRNVPVTWPASKSTIIAMP